MKQLLFFILIVLVRCTPVSTGYEDSSPVVVIDPEITKLKAQVAALNIQISSLNLKLSSLTSRYTRDSTLQWVQIKPAYALIPKVSSLDSRYTRDSTLQWAQIKPATAVIPKVSFLTTRYYNDSITQWVAIKKLQGASPVTQIPIMQAQILTIQSKNTAQDKTISAISIKNDSLQNVIIKYATKLDLNQFTISGNVATITGWNTLQTRVTTLEKLIPPGGQK